MKKMLFLLVIGTGMSMHVNGQPGDPLQLKLNHIAVYVSDLQKSTSFYQSALLLTKMDEPFHDGKHTWFNLGSAGHLHLIVGEGEDGPHHRNDHLCFSVNSLDQFIDNLEKLHIEYSSWSGQVKSVNTRVDGVHQIYFQDPDGHWIEVNDDRSVK